MPAHAGDGADMQSRTTKLSFAFVLTAIAANLSYCKPPPPPLAVLCNQDIQKRCSGCNPYLERLSVTMTITGMDTNAVLETKNCGDVSLNASVKDKKLAEAGFKGCLNTTRTIDAKTRDRIFDQIDKVQISDEEYRRWLDCARPVEPKRPFVVLMDSHLPDVVYCDDTKNQGASNTDDIYALIKDLPIAVGKEPTSLEWQDDQRIIGLKPDLVVVHASSFYKETKEMDGNTRLLGFLDALKGTGIKVLVYTRGLPNEPSEGIKERWARLQAKMADADVRRNTTLYVMTKGQASCFHDPDVGRPFKVEIKGLLGLN